MKINCFLCGFALLIPVPGLVLPLTYLLTELQFVCGLVSIFIPAAEGVPPPLPSSTFQLWTDADRQQVQLAMGSVNATWPELQMVILAEASIH